MKALLRFRNAYRIWHSPPTPEVLSSGMVHLLRWEHDDLSAPFWRWYANNRAGAFVRVNKTTIPLLPGRIYLIPPRTPFATWMSDGVEVGHLHVHFMLGLDQSRPDARIFDFEATPEERRLVRVAGRQLSAGDEAAGVTIGFVVQALINRALARVPDAYWRGRATDDRMVRVLRRIKAGIAGGVDNAVLAREAGLSPNAFVRFFRDVAGETPHRYLLRLRVERACEWLRASEPTVDEIAQATGFCDRFHFSRVFKRHMGLGPSEYRRRHRSGPTGRVTTLDKLREAGRTATADRSGK